jgi:hypothetical protein
MDRKWIGNAQRQKPYPFGVAINGGCELRTGSSDISRLDWSSYVRFSELDRAGRTVGKRLKVRSPGAGGDDFGVALEQCAGAGVGAEGHGSGGDRDRRTATALLETREAGCRVMRIVL